MRRIRCLTAKTLARVRAVGPRRSTPRLSGVIRVTLTVGPSLPVYPDERIFDASFADYRQLGLQLRDAFGVCVKICTLPPLRGRYG